MKKIIAFVFLIIAVVFLYFVNGFYGNPISKEISKITTKKYVVENYSEDYKFSKIDYNFKTGKYEVVYKKENSLDEHFSVFTNSFGKVDGDDYEYTVENKWNTYTRLNSDINDQTSSILNELLSEDERDFVYMGFKYEESFGNKLVLNQKIDIKNPPMDLEISLNKHVSEVNYEVLARHLIDIDRLLSSHNIKANYYNVSLNSKNSSEISDSFEVYAYQLKYEDWIIYKDDVDELAGFLKEYRENWDEKNDVK